VESFRIRNAVGGECREAFERLREDPGLAARAGYERAESGGGAPVSRLSVLQAPSARCLHQYNKARLIPNSWANAPCFSPSFIRSRALCLKAAEQRTHFRFAFSDMLSPFAAECKQAVEAVDQLA
jgi:hypothetical protein